MRTLLLVVALPALASPLAAQAPSVSLGNAVIYLGMSEDSVTDILAEFGYTTLTVSGSPEGGVVVRTPEDELVGAIGFDNSDNVDTIRRYWGPDNDQDAFPMAVAITEALMSIAGPPNANGVRTCDCVVEIHEQAGTWGFSNNVFIYDRAEGTTRHLDINSLRSFEGVPDGTGSISEVVTNRE